MMTLRGAGGFGDSLYMYPVLKWYLEQGEKIEILTKYPDVYKPLKELGLVISDRYSKEPDRECRYAPRYPIQTTTTYKDTLLLSGITTDLPFKIEFECENEFDFDTDKKICVIRNPTMPMKGKQHGEALIPDCSIFQKIIYAFKDDLFFVLAGNPEGHFKFELKGIDADLTNQLNIPEVFQLALQSDIVLTQCGFFIPICEALDRKCFILFAASGMKSTYKFFPHITPKKVINNYDMVDYAIDSEPHNEIIDKFGRLLVRGEK